ncbi:MAG: AAA family ATPase [Synechococcales bacterium]|nr:AAA family ATPase [Synechococcales bacterium]
MGGAIHPPIFSVVMAREKLIVENFASITALELELRSINVLIGKQAVGKSVCIKLVYFFKQFIWQMLESAENQEDKRGFDRTCLEQFTQLFPYYTWEKTQFRVRYEIADLYIELSGDERSKKPKFSYSEQYRKEFQAIRKYWAAQYQSLDFSDFTGAPNALKFDIAQRFIQQFPQEARFSQLFIPSGRSFFSLLQKNIFSFLSSKNEIDPLLTQFGVVYERLKFLYVKEGFLGKDAMPKEIQELTEKILRGRYIYDGEDDRLLAQDGRVIHVLHSSSGQQEALPLVVILPALLRIQGLGHGKAIYIEEPEAHIFPDSQKSIIELIATVYNSNQEGLSQEGYQFFITTHSPYILTAFNNLLQAGELHSSLKGKHLQKKLNKIVPKSRSLSYQDMTVYSLENGTAINIMSEELGLIDTNIIDNVSNQMSIEFGNLLDLAE